MSLRLVLGRAGSGKTFHCLQAIAQHLERSPQGPPLVLLVPEQATFQMEQALLRAVHERTGRPGFARARVFSFQRLAWWILGEAGGGHQPTVTPLGRLMVLRALVEHCRDRLRLFGPVADRPGFVRRLAASLEELVSWGCCAEDLRKGGGALKARGLGESLLAAKLHDLAVVASAYEAFRAGRFLEPAERLALAARRVGRSGLAGGFVWVDGFSSFTPQERRILEALMTAAAELEVTLCLDPRELPDAVLPGGDAPGGRDPLEAGLSPFYPTLTTYRELLERARQLGVAVAPLVLPSGAPRFRAPVLAHLERELFAYPGEPFAGPPDGLTVVAAPNGQAEVEAAALEILRLVRDEGLRFRDVAVVAADLERDHPLIEAVFRAYGIPVFVDRLRPVPYHPAVELVRSAIEAVLHDWAYEPVFRYLKTDLVPLSRDEVDRLENYVLAFGLRGGRWWEQRPWDYRRRRGLEGGADGGGGDEGRGAAEEPEAEERASLDAARRRAAHELSHFHRRVQAARTAPVPVGHLTAALRQLLEELEVREQLEAWSEQAERAGDLQAAQEHLQVWQGLSELLDQALALMADVPMTLGEYRRVVEAGLEGLRVGLIPPALDQVVVGTAQRSRHPQVRAVLLLGATEPGFPQPVPAEDVVFSDPERDELEQAGLRLGPAGRDLLLQQAYLAYVALTRASDRLWIGYPLSDEDGRPLTPSFLLRRLQAIVPGLEVAAAGRDDDPAAVATPEQLVAAVVRQVRRGREGAAGDPFWEEVHAWLEGCTRPGETGSPPGALDGRLRDLARAVLPALRHTLRARPLPPDLAERLYGGALLTSPSALESFARCPFQHFARYGLGLRERPVYRLEAPDIGQLYHAVLSRFAQLLDARGLDWAALDPQQARLLVAGAVDELAPRLHHQILASTAYHRYLLELIRARLERAVLTLCEHARRGSFRPVGVEVSFGLGSARLPALVYELGDGRRVVVRGRIDRVDAARTESGRRFVRVIDYKSGRQDLPLDEAYHGLALQLGLYLRAALNGAERLLAEAGAPAEPAGMLYVGLHDPLIPADGPLPEEKARQLYLRASRASGWVLDDPEAIAAMDRTGTGDLLPVRLTKDGRPHGGSRVASRRQLDALLARLEDRVRELGRRLLEGHVEPSPYRMGSRWACDVCELRDVCGFEVGLPDSRPRVLPSMKPGEVWARLGVGAG